MGRPQLSSSRITAVCIRFTLCLPPANCFPKRPMAYQALSCPPAKGLWDCPSPVTSVAATSMAVETSPAILPVSLPAKRIREFSLPVPMRRE